MLSDERTVTIVREVPKMVRRLSSASQYDSRFAVKNHEKPWQCNGVGSFQWKSGPGWFVLPYNKM